MFEKWYLYVNISVKHIIYMFQVTAVRKQRTDTEGLIQMVHTMKHNLLSSGEWLCVCVVWLETLHMRVLTVYPRLGEIIIIVCAFVVGLRNCFCVCGGGGLLECKLRVCVFIAVCLLSLVQWWNACACVFIPLCSWAWECVVVCLLLCLAILTESHCLYVYMCVEHDRDVCGEVGF